MTFLGAFDCIPTGSSQRIGAKFLGSPWKLKQKQEFLLCVSWEIDRSVNWTLRSTAIKGQTRSQFANFFCAPKKFETKMNQRARWWPLSNDFHSKVNVGILTYFIPFDSSFHALHFVYLVQRDWTKRWKGIVTWTQRVEFRAVDSVQFNWFNWII